MPLTALKRLSRSWKVSGGLFLPPVAAALESRQHALNVQSGFLLGVWGMGRDGKGWEIVKETPALVPDSAWPLG